MKRYPYFIILFILTVIIDSCKKKDVEPPITTINTPLLVPQVIFKNVVILGNSITLTPLSPQIGWNNTWGMAASCADSDYVHHLMVQFKRYNPDCKITVRAFDQFESNYSTYDFDAKLKDLKDSKPDLLIIRIGENIDVSHLDKAVFKSRYKDLVTYFTADNSQLHILSGGTLWGLTDIDDVLKAYTPFVSLSTLTTDPTNFAVGLFTDINIQRHPGDKGMHILSTMLWNAACQLKAK